MPWFEPRPLTPAEDAELRHRIHDLTTTGDWAPVEPPSGCDCYCHLPGARVVTVDGAPCCSDMADPAAPPPPAAPPVGPNVSAVRPKALDEAAKMRREQSNG